jgi:hypothetical protein
MTTLSAIDIARTFFREAYAGAEGGASWFVSAEPDQGVLGTLSRITAAQASRAPAPGARSIAAHAEHLRWSLAAVNDTLRGEPWNPDWSASWSVQEVSESDWDALRAGLEGEFQRALEALEEDRDWSDPMMLTGVCALAPHAAYHLGAIRQIQRAVAR